MCAEDRVGQARLACAELERGAPSHVSVADPGALGRVLAKLDAAREDLEAMRREAPARRTCGCRSSSRWWSRAGGARAGGPVLSSAVRFDRRRVPVAGARRARRDPTGHDRLRLRANVGGPRGPYAIPIDDRRVRILWNGEAPGDLPAASKTSAIVPWRGFEDEPPTGMAPP